MTEKNIVLSDTGNFDSEIDVLIGADVAGKLLTGKKVDLANGLTAFETLLGWTVMRKIPEKYPKDDTVTMLTSMLVQNADISDL